MSDDSSFRAVVDGHAIGVAMRLARRRLGLSQRALADALGWDRAKVGRWESGGVPEDFLHVVSVLRVLGFGLELAPLDGAGFAACDEPAEHLADRGQRRFPAHLELCEEYAMSTWNWTRHRGEPSPAAARTSFRRRTQVDAAADEAGILAAPCADGEPSRKATAPPEPPVAS